MAVSFTKCGSEWEKNDDLSQFAVKISSTKLKIMNFEAIWTILPSVTMINQWENRQAA